jgi:hypothetical protein
MNAKRITILALLVISVSLTPAVAQVFDIPATGAWVKMQDGEITQWSAISSAQPKTRIDLVSYVEEGERITYYLIRTACSNGKITSAVIKPGNMLGIGVDCDGYTVTTYAAVLGRVQKLPTEAAALLKR